MKKCSFCSKLEPDDVVYCSVCGQQLDVTQPADNTMVPPSIDEATHTVPISSQNSYAQGVENNDYTQTAHIGGVNINSGHATPPPPPHSQPNYGGRSGVPPQSYMQQGNYETKQGGRSCGNNSKQWVLWILIGVVAVALLAVGGYVAFNMMSTPSVLKVIPADDSDLVITADGKNLLQSAGFEMSGGKILLPRTLQGIVNRAGAEQQRILDNVLAAKCFDISRVAFVFNFTKNDIYEIYCVASINNRNEAIALFERVLDGDNRFYSEGEYDVCNYGYRDFVIVNDSYCWIYSGTRHVVGGDYGTEMTSADAIRRIDDIVSKADDRSIADVSYKRSVLGGSNAVAAFFDSYNICELNGVKLGDFMGNPKYNNAQVGLEADLNGMSIEVVARVYDENGCVVEMSPYSAEIDGSFTKYLANNDILVTAVAIDDDIPWESQISQMEEKTGKRIPYEVRSELLPMLSSLEGTSCFAVGMNGAFSEVPDLMMIVGVKDGKAQDLLAKMAELLRREGKCYVNYNGSVLEFKPGNVLFKAEERDGDIFISNRPVSTDGNSAITTSMFSGNMAAIVAHIDSGSQLAVLGGLPGDVTAQLSSDNKELKLYIELEGADGYAGLLDFVLAKAIAISKL